MLLEYCQQNTLATLTDPIRVLSGKCIIKVNFIETKKTAKASTVWNTQKKFLILRNGKKKGLTSSMT